MQAVEQKKTVTISPEVHRKIVTLRKGNQTYGDVVAESIKALEEKQQREGLLCESDIDWNELDKKISDADADFDNNYISLEDSMKRRYEGKHKTA